MKKVKKPAAKPMKSMGSMMGKSMPAAAKKAPAAMKPAAAAKKANPFAKKKY